MQCPKCHHQDTRVIDSRPEREGRTIRRRRECDKCGFRFSTVERISMGGLLVRKKNKETEKFSPEKLEQSISVACGKRPISQDQIREVVQELSENWASKSEVTSSEIGEAVMDALKEIDHVAYIRFASVYRRFKDVDEFKKEIAGLL
jgi:transcriptional repressor NrdR